MRKWLLLSIGLASFLSTAAPQAAQQAQQLDYGFYKTRVEPIFLSRRTGHARCYACHALGAGEGNAPAAMRFELLSPGTTTWNEEQSRKNFEAVSRKVVPGKPLASPLLIHPLRYEAGGDQWHGGGAQFTSANDPEWQTIAAWVLGKNTVSEGTVNEKAATKHDGYSPSQGLKLRIVQTNMAGDNLHIIDPVSNRVVAEITGIEANHGVAAAPDGSRLYVSNEADRTVDVVDMRTLKVFKKFNSVGRPTTLQSARMDEDYIRRSMVNRLVWTSSIPPA